MMMRYLRISLLLYLLLTTCSAEQDSTLIVGGEQAGPFRLNIPFSQVEQRLGRPTAQQATTGDPGTTFRAYKNYKIGFLVNPESTVIGVTIARKDWKTAQGLGVGSPVSAFQELYGKGLKRGPGQLAFPEFGLAVTFSQGVVETIYVVKIDEADKVKGDQLLVAGSRAGQMRLGTSSKDLLELLGPPMQKEGAEQNIWVYPDRGIRLGFIQGRLYMVGVTSGDWVTPSGLKVGRPFADMKRELGNEYRFDNSSVFFDKWGIGARLQGDQIVEILIFNPRTSDGRG